MGFDLILLLAFAATGWVLAGPPIVIACLRHATLLCCDAWSTWSTSATRRLVSVAAAVFVELMALPEFNAAQPADQAVRTDTANPVRAG